MAGRLSNVASRIMGGNGVVDRSVASSLRQRSGMGLPVGKHIVPTKPLPTNDELIWDNGTPFPEPCIDRIADTIGKYEALGWWLGGLGFFATLGLVTVWYDKPSKIPFVFFVKTFVFLNAEKRPVCLPVKILDTGSILLSLIIFISGIVQFEFVKNSTKPIKFYAVLLNAGFIILSVRRCKSGLLVDKIIHDAAYYYLKHVYYGLGTSWIGIHHSQHVLCGLLFISSSLQQIIMTPKVYPYDNLRVELGGEP